MLLRAISTETSHVVEHLGKDLGRVRYQLRAPSLYEGAQAGTIGPVHKRVNKERLAVMAAQARRSKQA